VRNAFSRGGENCQITCGDIQKEFARFCAEEVTEVIMGELGNKKLSVLIDESRDISIKEQIAVMLRLVVQFCSYLLVPVLSRILFVTHLV
jgi:hypothetical protein